MTAERIMTTELVVAEWDESIEEVYKRMHDAKLRMLPVLNDEKCIVGVISTYSLLKYVVPDYLVSGELNKISYAPDMGILTQRYKDIATKTIADVMDDDLLLVQYTESLISVSAALTAHGRHEYAMVINKEQKLLGVISAGDIINQLSKYATEVNDA